MAKKYIVVQHNADGSTKVSDHDSKADAHKVGGALRAAGKTVFVHPKDEANRLGLDPRKAPLKVWSKAN